MTRSAWQIVAAIVLFVFCTSCGSDSANERRLCDAQIRRSIVDIQSITSRKDPEGAKFKSERDEFRTVLDRCTVTSGGVSITDNTARSEVEVYVIAGLYEEVQSRLSLVALLNDSDRASLLFVAARYGDLGTLKTLVQSGLDATMIDNLGNNAISETVDSPVPAEGKIEFLVRAGVDPLAKSADNFSALDGAVLAGDIDATKKMLSMLSSSNEHNHAAVTDALALAKRLGSPVEQSLETWLAPQ